MNGVSDTLTLVHHEKGQSQNVAAPFILLRFQSFALNNDDADKCERYKQ